MKTEKQDHSPENTRSDQPAPDWEKGTTDLVSTQDVEETNSGNHLPKGQTGNDVATDTGSTIDTLDTAFHNGLDIHKGQAMSGSNRADFYESRSFGKTDSEEELEALSRKNEPKPEK